MKQKVRQASNRKAGKVKDAPKLPEHGSQFRVSIDQMEPNDWNPNEMTPAEFDALGENMDEVDFLDPVLVTFKEWGEDGKPRFRIIDGEHRWEQAKLTSLKSLPVIYADPDKVPELQQKKQTVKMNVLHGHPNKRKLLDLVEDVMGEEGSEMEDVAYEMGFVDYDAFQSLIADARGSLPSNEMKKEFDKAKDELKTVDDLSLLLNKLFTRFGDTLPCNFMILDFGGKKHIWIRMDVKSYNMVTAAGRTCMEEGYTFDSVIQRLIMLLDVPAFIAEHKNFLSPIPEGSKEGPESIDTLLREPDEVPE